MTAQQHLLESSLLHEKRNKYIFYLFCVVVPVFMAFNGGATAGSLNGNLHDTKNVTVADKNLHAWGKSELGALGAMDKIAMTFASPVLASIMTKLSLNGLRHALALNLAVITAAMCALATMQGHVMLFVAKIAIGVTEAFHWVWLLLWIDVHGNGKQSQWLSLSTQVAPAIGNGFGLVTGSAVGMYAFMIPAVFLFAATCVFLLIPMQDVECRSSSPAQTAETTKDVLDSLMQLGNNRLFWCITLACAMSEYTQTSIQYNWMHLIDSLWPNDSTYDPLYAAALVAVSGMGGALGLFCSKHASQESDVSVNNTIVKSYLIAWCGGLLVSAICISITVSGSWQSKTASPVSIVFQLLLWTGMATTFGGLASSSGFLYQQLLKSIETNTRSLAVGVFQGIYTLLGFALGPLAPLCGEEILTKTGCPQKILSYAEICILSHFTTPFLALVNWTCTMTGLCIGLCAICTAGTCKHGDEELMAG